ncbi:MAG: AAA family ATPase [Desulfobacteraceae bacterium]|nr:AAA family ATPase [Desulfobacteraceae bacterium]
MYNHFFGFQERPFKLVPNPAYLYLSRSHEEALAHLNYAVTDGEGFVEITGDVGTGKTLLCRTFLENLGPGVESAYIFNPRMDAVDLLKAINDEFGIPSNHDSKKNLMDALNTFLMQKKAEGRRVILLIDEAQNLSKEVLEQIRLLSNLETTKDKLLQIILVGQPELGEMLDSYELRQLGQRISLSCRLQALSLAETRQYIAHRIAVAAQKPADIFSAAAIRRIFRFSRGVPRLINIACDRALLTAYGLNRRGVSGRTARFALLELATRGEINRETAATDRKRGFALAALCAVLAIVLLYQSGIGGRKGFLKNAGALSPVVQPSFRPAAGRSTSGPPQPSPPAAAIQPAVLPAVPHADTSASGASKKTTLNLQERLITAGDLSRKTAFIRLLKFWHINSGMTAGLSEIPGRISNDMTFFSLAAMQNGLTATPVDNDLGRMVALNLPAILRFYHPLDRHPVYAIAARASSDAMTLIFDESGQTVEASYPEIMKSWDGSGFVFWKNFYNYKGVIAFSAPEEAVIALKLNLRAIGYSNIDVNGAFDAETQTAIKDIQARHGIPVDGFAGTLTQIVLYNETPSLEIPRLWEPGAPAVVMDAPKSSDNVKPLPESQSD